MSAIATLAAKAEGYDRAVRFYQELVEATETFSDIVNEFGERAFVDLMYLQQAIMTGDHIDHWPNESRVADVVALLPSAEEWMKHVKPIEEVTFTP
jgi:hypothetical protein